MLTVPTGSIHNGGLTVTAGTAGHTGAGSLTIARTGSTAGDVVVHYTVTGTVQAGADYAALSGMVTTPPGASSVTPTPMPLEGGTAGADDTTIPTLAAGTYPAPMGSATMQYRNLRPSIVEDIYKSRVELTLAGYQAESELTDFLVAVKLSTTLILELDWDDVGANGAKIRSSTLGSEMLPFEVDTWPADTTDSSAEAPIWVKLPFVKSIADGQTKFYLYLGADDDATPSPAAEETRSAHVGVRHMNETNGPVADATGHGLTAIVAEGNSASIAVSDAGAPTGTARQTGTSTKGYLSVPDNKLLDVGSRFTTSGWVKAYSVSQYLRIFSRKHPHNSSDGRETQTDQNSSTKLTISGAGASSYTAPINSITAGWVHLLIAYNDTAAKTLSNGSLAHSATTTAASDNDRPLSFGCNSDGSEYSLNGTLDEVRLLGAPVSDDWAKAEYDTLKVDGYVTAGNIFSLDQIDISSATAVYTNGQWGIDFTVARGQGNVYTLVTDSTDNTVKTLYGSIGPGTYFAPITGLTSGACYNFAIYVGPAEGGVTTDAGSVFIGDITISSDTDADLKTLQEGSFTVSLPANVTAAFDVTVNLSFGGDAVQGEDYKRINTTATIPADDNSVTVPVVPAFNRNRTASRTLTVTIENGSYMIGASSSASVAILPATNRWGVLDGQLAERELINTPWKFNLVIDGNELTIDTVAQTGLDKAIDLNDIEPPYTVAAIKGAFYKMPYTTLESLVLPRTLREIVNGYAFENVGAAITLPKDNQLVKIAGSAFNTANLTGDIVLSNIVDIAKEGLFNTKITSLTLGENYRYVAQDAIKHNAMMTNLVFLGSVTNVAQYGIHENSALVEWTWSNYPEFDALWHNTSDTNKKGAGTRWFVPLADAGWIAVTNAATFTPWAQVANDKKTVYHNTFGANAEDPIGYTTVPMETFLMRKPVAMVDKPRLVVTGVPHEYDAETVSPTYGDYKDIEASALPITFTAPQYFLENGSLRESTGYTFESYDYENDRWANAQTVAAHSFQYNPASASYDRLTWNWIDAGYTVKISGIIDGVSITTNADEIIAGVYNVIGSTATYTAVGDNFVRWYGDTGDADVWQRTISITVDGPKDIHPYFATQWVYDSSAQTISDGYWTFGVTVEGDHQLGIYRCIDENPDGVAIDFRKPVTDGWKIVKIWNGPKDRINLESRPLGFTTELFLPYTLLEASSFCFYCFKPPIRIPANNTITNIGYYSFRESGLAGDVVFDNLECLYTMALHTCNDLTSVVIGRKATILPLPDPSNPKSTGNDVAVSCPALTNVIMKGNVTYLGGWAFNTDKALREITFSSYPEFGIASDQTETKWLEKSNAGTGLRAFIPRDCDGWEEVIAGPNFTPWANCTDTQKNEYFAAFGQRARKPEGLLTAPYAMLLIYKNPPSTIMVVR